MAVIVDIGKAFRDLLLSKTEITDLTDQRIFSDYLPQTQKTPAIVFFVPTSEPQNGLAGFIGFDRSSFLVESYGITREAANELAITVWQNVANFQGIQDGVNIREISRRSGIVHRLDRPRAGSDDRRFISSQSLNVHFYSACEETLP